MQHLVQMLAAPGNGSIQISNSSEVRCCDAVTCSPALSLTLSVCSVRVRSSSGIRGRCVASRAARMPCVALVASPAVSHDTVCAAAALIVVLALALRRRLAKLLGLLVDTATFGRPPPQVLVVHCVAGPLHLLLSLPLPQFDRQAAALLLGWRRGARLHRLRYRFTGCSGDLRHPCARLPAPKQNDTSVSQLPGKHDARQMM